MATGILNHHITAAQAISGNAASPMAAAASGTGSTSSAASSSSDSATISANDFLTLLVTEMKNQDPTADTDPNEYINQLVNVNSLEQLISINQTLTTDLGSPAASSNGATPSAQAVGATSSPAGASAQTQAARNGSTVASAQPASSGAATTVPEAINAAATKLAPGNLGIPAASQASRRLAQVLNGQPQ
jgi:flagellar basal-body rod modification protein FlgD